MYATNCSKSTLLRPVGGRGRYVHVFINEMLSWPEGYILIGSYNVVVCFIQGGKKIQTLWPQLVQLSSKMPCQPSTKHRRHMAMKCYHGGSSNPFFF